MPWRSACWSSAASPLLRRRLAAVALSAVRRRTWESAMERLAAGYRRASAEPQSASDTPQVRAVPPSDRTIAVALHDIEPATFERCALIRDWLRRPRRRPRHAARDPRSRPASPGRALTGDGRLAARAPAPGRLDRPARLPARAAAPRRWPRRLLRPARARRRRGVRRTRRRGDPPRGARQAGAC